MENLFIIRLQYYNTEKIREHIPKNEVEPVPEIQGKAKAGHKKAKPM